MKNKKRTQRKKTVLLLSILAVVIVGALLYAYRNRLKNDTAEDSPSTIVTNSESTVKNPNSTINYDPSSPSDNDAINEQKNNPSSQSTPVDSTLSATITRAQISGNVAQIRVLVSGTDNGSCMLKLMKEGSSTITKSSGIIYKGTFFTCDGFDIPVNELSNGTWKVQIILSSGGKQSSPTESSLQVGS